MRAVVLVAALVALAQLAWAEEQVFHCVETNSVGFLFTEEHLKEIPDCVFDITAECLAIRPPPGSLDAQATTFKENRFVMKVSTSWIADFLQRLGVPEWRRRILALTGNPLSYEDRTITQTTGDPESSDVGYARKLTCRKALGPDSMSPSLLVCVDEDGVTPWLFRGHAGSDLFSFVRSYFDGPPIAGAFYSKHITISYGVCERFRG